MQRLTGLDISWGWIKLCHSELRRPFIYLFNISCYSISDKSNITVVRILGGWNSLLSFVFVFLREIVDELCNFETLWCQDMNNFSLLIFSHPGASLSAGSVYLMGAGGCGRELTRNNNATGLTQCLHLVANWSWSRAGVFKKTITAIMTAFLESCIVRLQLNAFL